MNTNPLKAELERLGTYDDVTRIKSSLHGICSKFGTVSRLEVLLAGQHKHRQALCFLRMESTEQELPIMRSLGFTRCADELVLAMDLQGVAPGSDPVSKPTGSMSA